MEDMKPIPNTLRLFQVEGKEKQISHNEYMLTVSDLPCSCLQCRIDSSNSEMCLYKSDRNVRSIIVSKKDNVENTEEKHELASLTIVQLQLELRERCLPINGSKTVLLNRLIRFIEDETACDDEGEESYSD